jgi:diaminohydroxyphosphoribosylaminopyrimidine deaminase/5-amino-6-(5-phosphoribosylamino)uracil reductase
MMESEDIKFMRRCIELASKAEGFTYPNPLVGSVIVYDDKILGEGYHLRSGEAHAEVNAINSVTDKSKLKHSTLYVNLEPCSHFGKTPPCADYIISNAIQRIVIGTFDTSEKVSGQGVKKLSDAGCDVKVGVLDDECRKLNRRFFTFNEKKRPYITLKWAQSVDGYLDILRTPDHKTDPTWITGKPERVLVHKWRASEQAILAGAGTVLTDNPRLDVREWSGHDPLKLILSGTGSVAKGSYLNNTKGRVVVFTHNPDTVFPGGEKQILKKNIPSSVQICEYLYALGIQSLFIEGGAAVLGHFIATGLWDEARIFTGQKHFKDGVKAPVLKGLLSSRTVFDGSFLEILFNNASQVREIDY